MPTIEFLYGDGERAEIEVEGGANIMRTATCNGIPGIIAECGGACMCATCHVYVDKDGAAAFPEIGEIEEEMLECTTAERRPESRLGCQLFVPEGVDRITIKIPALPS